jgi:hypothetical protein
MNTKPATMKNKYKEGEEVYAKADPTQKLIVRRYVDRIYYCKLKEDPTRQELAYFEREITNLKTI